METYPSFVNPEWIAHSIMETWFSAYEGNGADSPMEILSQEEVDYCVMHYPSPYCRPDSKNLNTFFEDIYKCRSSDEVKHIHE